MSEEEFEYSSLDELADAMEQAAGAPPAVEVWQDYDPSMRFVADLRDWDDSSMLLTLGESGVWTDSHYADMERDWVDIAWSPTPFSDSAVQKATQDLLRLEPARP